VLFLRFSRDRRGYEHTYLIHSPSKKGSPTRILYWFRTPPGVKVGRLPFDDDVRRTLEAQYPALTFDWNAIAETPVPPPSEAERWRERRQADRAARQARREERPEREVGDEGIEQEPVAPESPEEPPSERHTKGPSGEIRVHTTAQPGSSPGDGGPGVASSRRRRRRGGRRRVRPENGGSTVTVAADQDNAPGERETDMHKAEPDG
jgi:hypothetical protein